MTGSDTTRLLFSGTPCTLVSVPYAPLTSFPAPAGERMSEKIPPKHKTVDKDGYRLTFYPGFLRKGTVRVDGQDDVLYEQGVAHPVKDKPDEPLTRWELRLKGGPNKRNFTLHVNDPQREIAEIVVKLYPRGHKAEGAEDSEPDEEFLAKNDAMLCPPIC